MFCVDSQMQQFVRNFLQCLLRCISYMQQLPMQFPPFWTCGFLIKYCIKIKKIYIQPPASFNQQGWNVKTKNNFVLNIIFHQKFQRATQMLKSGTFLCHSKLTFNVTPKSPFIEADKCNETLLLSVGYRPNSWKNFYALFY